MHHALEIQEILSNIFWHFFPRGGSKDPERRKANSVLAALARTCRTFKEPALDRLWNDFDDLSPLARCLPEASYRLSSESEETTYAFNRPLTEPEWGILQSYTFRIRSIMRFNDGLDWESVAAFLSPFTTKPLFPNLRTLCCTYTDKTRSLLRLPLPSLVTLLVWFDHLEPFQEHPESFPMFSPNIKTLFVRTYRLQATFIQMKPSYVCRWQNLSRVVCPRLALDLDDLGHLSRTPSLTQLEFALSATLPDPDLPLAFSKLRSLAMNSETLAPISQLLSHVRLPALTRFHALINNCPSNKDFTSFMTAIPTSNASYTIQNLQLIQSHHNVTDFLRLGSLVLSCEDLRPCTVFDLRHMELDIACNVGMTDSKLLSLASAWPKLEQLLINADWGWNTLDGITPGGLVQLLQTCRSLDQIALRLDTRGYTEVLPSHVPANLGLTLPRELSIGVLDSAIEAESVAAISTFFHGIATCSGQLILHRAWSYDGAPMMTLPGAYEYMDLWDDVNRGICRCRFSSACESDDSDTPSLAM